MQLMIFGGLTLGLLLISSLVGTSLIARINHLSVTQLASMGPADFARPEMAGVIKGLLIVQFFGIFLLPSMVFAYLADPHPLAYVGLKAPQKKSFLLLGICIMIAAYFTVEFLGMLNEAIVNFLPKTTQSWIERGETDANSMLQNVLSVKSQTDLLKTIVLVGALPAIGEELFFRGILQKLFIQIFKSALPGIIFTGFLFSAFHMQFMGLLPRMALGIILGSLYWYSGSLYTSILGHFLYNTINVFLIYFKIADLDSKPVSGIVFSLVGLISLALVVFLLNVLRKKSSTRYQSEYPVPDENILFDDRDHPV
jgi:membrane protease YdiL (CAAX protease family)